jgi:hypothetical protein
MCPHKTLLASVIRYYRGAEKRFRGERLYYSVVYKISTERERNRERERVKPLSSTKLVQREREIEREIG